MGNCFSTRWSRTIVRQDTDPLPKLDVRWLHRIGALEPGALAQPSWRRGEHQVDTITTYVNLQTQDVLILDYWTQQPGKDPLRVQEAIPFISTPCTFGGERVWFQCPSCQCRRAVLFCLQGWFRCRECHALAYTSTRENKQKRAMRRYSALSAKTGTNVAEPNADSNEFA